VSPLPALANEFVTFGCLNNPAKISDSAVALWSEVMRAVPGSKLILLSPVPNVHLLARFAAHGIAPERLILIPRQSRSQYLQRFSQIDIALDPFPYTGETTTCDGLWMGVPTVTLLGKSMASRRGASILHNVGLSDWIARTPGEYVNIAARMTSSLSARAALRSTLRERMRHSLLTDGPRYTRHLESVYRRIWREWCGK
jgi:protein O-GlcNAc transferase